MGPGTSHPASLESRAILADPNIDTIPTLLGSWANKTPDAPALLAPERTSLSYQQLHTVVVELNRLLNRHGIGRGDRVALVLPNGLDAALMTLAVAASATCAPLNPNYRAREFDFYLSDLQATAVIVPSSMANPVRSVAAERGIAILELTSADRAVDRFTLTGGLEARPTKPGFALSDDIALALHTSGTTSRPKLVPLTHRNICQSARNIVASLRLTHVDRGLNVMPLFHIHGLIGMLLSSLTAGGSLVCLPEFSPIAFHSTLKDYRATWYSAVPTIHQAILSEANLGLERIQPHQLRLIRSSSAALPASVLQGLERTFAAPVIEAYGMTEAAHQMASNPLPPMARKPGSVGLAAGPEVAILDSEGNALAPGLTGEVAIRGANVFGGYKRAPEANSLAFSDGWFRTGDQGFLDEEGYLFLTGRLKEMINRGGEKIAPREVDDILLRHPGVEQAVTFSMPHPTLGEEVAAAIVLRPGEVASERELQDFVSHRIADFKVPRRILFMDELPKGATGKLVRVGLAEKLGLVQPAMDTQRPGPALASAFTPAQKLVAEAWGQVLGHGPTSLDDNFFLAGGDSLSSMRLISRLRDAFRVEISPRIVFDAPTVLELADRLAAIQTEPPDPDMALPLVPESGARVPILSIEQRRLWLLEQRDSSSGLENVPIAVRLRGQINRQVLEMSLSYLLQRHDILRATFPTRNWSPSAVIHPNLPVNLPLSDLSDLSESDNEIELERLLQREALHPFDLASGPLIRTHLVRVADEDHVLLMTTHKIVADQSSVQLLLTELFGLYAEMQQSITPSTHEQAFTYVDYASWQQANLHGERRERFVSYWNAQLADMPPPLQLPLSKPRPNRLSHRTNTIKLSLPADLRDNLQALGHTEGATLFMTLLAAWQTLLLRYSGQDDLIAGIEVEGRARLEFERTIGCFSDTRLLRTTLSGSPSFREVLARVRNTALDAYAHHDLPFALVEEAATDERERAVLHPQVMLRWREPLSFGEISGLDISTVDVALGTSAFDLTLTFRNHHDGLEGWLEYSTDRFNDGQMCRMVDHFRTLAQGIVRDPGQPITTLPLLGPSERQQILVDWNATAAPIPNQTLPELFTAQVERTPDAIALVFGEQQLSYQQLNRRANQLAHRLQREAVGPEVLVGVCVERSIEMIVALLAVLKAGGAYVPIDPRYPAERIAFMLADSQVPLLLTQSHLVSSLAGNEAKLIVLDPAWSDTATFDAEHPLSSATLDNLAFLIYTSGSTGRPKGVMIEHRSLSNQLVDQIHQFHLDAQTRQLQFSPMSFDVSVGEIFATLASGGTLVLVQQEIVSSPTELKQLLQEQGITHLSMPPSMLAVLDASDLPEIRNIVAAGEACRASIVQRWADGRRFINGYGPTETTIYASTYVCDPRENEDPPIGRPSANMRLYVLDQHLQPMPVGIPGELYIGGVGVARGYLHRPELTVERFLSDPFSTDPGARMYKTGDQVRYRTDGALEYLGRLDQQVKLRGYRIELGEIEAVLTQHPAVRAGVVLLREDQPGDPRLVAYVIYENGEMPAVGDLRHFLAQRLPEYMLPAAFVATEHFPLAPSGKVDRRAFPAPGGERPGLATSFQEPRDEIERWLVETWQDVLGLDRVGTGDNFFELGGHSLLAAQVISRIHNRFQVTLPFGRFFENPTIRVIARIIEESPASPAVQPVHASKTPIRRAPCSFAQERLWFLEQLEPGRTIYSIAQAVRLSGPLDQQALGRSIQEIIRRHDSLRTTFDAADGRPYQVIHRQMPVPMTVIDFTGQTHHDREESLKQYIAAATRRPFDLNQGPLLRTTLFALGADDHLLLLTMHHIVSDGWSMHVLWRELGDLYASRFANQPARLPGLEVQYANFSEWQRGSLAGDTHTADLAYWTTQLVGAPPVLELPTDYPRPATQTFKGTRYPFELSGATSVGMTELSQREGTTTFMAFLAAFQILLYRYSGQSDLVIGTPIAGRTRPELEGLIGFFVNTLPLRTDLSGQPSVRDLLARVRQTALDAYDHQELPFEQLVEALHPPRDLSYTPVVQVLFNFYNMPITTLELPMLEVHPIDVETETSKFDLALVLRKVGDQYEGWFEYSSDLFRADTIARMAKHFAILLDAILADPDQTIDSLALLTPQEREQILDNWNVTSTPVPNQNLSELFTTQVQRSPDAIAVIAGNQQLSYRQLDKRANQLAHHLQALGVGPEVCVGLCVERSPELLIGILATLKAGGVYVPLDPSYPSDRLAFMLAEIKAPLLLTSQHLVDRIPPGSHQIVCLDIDWPVIAQHPTNTPIYSATPDNLAYIIFTSGSTGAPKGVMIEHRGLLNYLNYLTKTFRLSSTDVTLQLPRMSFDASVRDFLAPLISGACIVLISQADSRDPAMLLSTIRERGVTCLLAIIPRMLRQLSEFAYRSGMVSDTVRLILVGGEALQLADCRHVPDAFGKNVLLVNQYGPTEITMTATYHPVAVPFNERDIALIGRPIQNMRAYVLDPQRQPLPVGVPGELYISGVGVARGYLNQPELTAKHFLPDPFSPEPGTRMYQTGDQARYRPDGNLEFLGRLDYQVKLRGYRIELGEIEAVLAQHPAVRDVVVVLREDLSGDQRLIAYLIFEPDHQTYGNALRQYLSTRLPDYMIPSAFVPLDAFPLSPNGKLDRKALPVPKRSPLESAPVPPRTPSESTIAIIWAELLGFESIGVHDNFFDIGGHSLMAMQLTLRLNDAFQVDMPLRTIFLSPTIAELASAILESQIEELSDMELLELLDIDLIADDKDRLSLEIL